MSKERIRVSVGEAILSAIGGRGNLIQLNREKDCGCDEGQLQQV